MTLNKVVSLNTPKKETYGEAVTRHSKEISAELRDSNPEVLVIVSLSAEGMSYQVMTDNSTLEVLGALEVLKSYFLLDSLGE